MTKKIEFTQEQRDLIKQTLNDSLKITDEATQDAYVNSLEETGTLRAFGFGSLLTYSHLHNDDKTFSDDLPQKFPGLQQDDLIRIKPADLLGYKRDFVCYDIVYRGTAEKPGITLGLDKDENNHTPGGVLETRIDHLNPNIAANFVEYYLKKFAAREFPPNMPIYKFDFLNVKTQDGNSVPSLVCIADDKGPLYIHNPENDFAKRNPWYAIGREEHNKRVQIMATAHNPARSDGSAKPHGAVTDLDYLRNTINSALENGVFIEPRFHRLYADAVLYRMHMIPEERAKLQSYERDGMASNRSELLGDFMVAVGAHNERVSHPDSAPSASAAPAP